MTRRILALVVLSFAPTIGGASAQAPTESPRKLDRIVISRDRTHFVREGTADRFVLWGFNYDRDDAGRLIEDYWADEWETVAGDFREMKALGANVVRVHLQVGRFLKDPGHADEANLGRLRKLVRLAEETGLYLDVTGLGCYRKADVPPWYDALGESARWDAQATFWRAVAGACQGSPAVFCYDLMNEPILGGGDGKEKWLPGEPLGDKYYVQRITIDVRGRSDQAIARDWVARLAGAVRSVDDRTPITVGEIPWSQVFPGAKPLFHSPEVGGPLDFASVHLYPRKGKLDEDIAALKAYEVGKPLVIEEFFPLQSSFEEAEAFLARSRPIADGWLSFYWGKSIAESKAKGDLGGAILAGWLERFQALAPKP